MEALDALLALSPSQFEQTVAGYLESLGYSEPRVVGGAGDLGVDVRCKDEFGRLVVAQCKRYQPSAKITSPEIQRFYGMVVRANAARGIFVTTSTFTEPASRLARDCDIELVSGEGIAAYYLAILAEQRRREELRRAEAERVQAEHRRRAEEHAEAERRRSAEALLRAQIASAERRRDELRAQELLRPRTPPEKEEFLPPSVLRPSGASTPDDHDLPEVREWRRVITSHEPWSDETPQEHRDRVRANWITAAIMVLVVAAIMLIH